MRVSHDHPRILDVVETMPTEQRQLVLQLRRGLIEQKTVNFLYDGKIRVVEVHAIGQSIKDGSPVMRGFQVAGVASRPLPQWTLFSIAKIENLTFGKEGSGAPREGYAQGDKQMQQPVLCELVL
jgi:hypothetical protein